MRSKAIKAGLVWLGVVGVLSGCVENRVSVTLKKMLVPDSNCVVTADSDTFITMGTLDIGEIGNYPTQYFMFPQVENNLLSTEESEGIELNMIELIEARVTLDFGALGGALDADTTQFRYPAFITLAPGDHAGVQVLGIPEATARVIASQLPNDGDSAIVRLRLKFLYQHGEYERETHEIEFPVLVCRHCLITAPDNLVLCNSGQITDSSRQGNGCNIVQDIPVDCCLAGSQLLCPAVDTSASGTTAQ